MSANRTLSFLRAIAISSCIAASSLPGTSAAAAAASGAATVDGLHARIDRLLAANRASDALSAAKSERDLARKAFGAESEASARALIDIGRAAEAAGNMADAEEAYRGGIIVKSRLFRGKTSADIRAMIEDLHSYGSFLVLQSRFSEAEVYLNGAAALASKMKPFDAGVAVPVLIAFASVETHLDKLEVAQSLATSVVEAWRKSRLPPDIAVRNAYIILGQIADRREAYAVSESWYDKALAIHIPGDNRSILYGTLHASMGQVDLDDATFGGKPSRLDEAERHFTTALTIYRAQHADYLQTYYVEEQLAEVYGVRKQFDRSVAAFEVLFKEMRRVFDEQFAFMSEDDRLAFQDATSTAFRQFYVVAWDARVTGGQDATLQMYDIALWQKGLVLRSIESLRSQVATLKDPTIDDLFAKITSARTHIADASVAKGHDASTLFSDLDALNYQEQELARTLTQRGFQPKSAPETWQQVVRALRPDEAAIEFVDTGKSYMALVLTPTQHGIVLLGNEERVGRDALAAYRAEFGLGGSAGKESFYDIVWKPLVPLLKGVARVYVASDGVLNQIPLDAVADDEGKLLMQDFDIRRVSSTRVLAEAEPALPKAPSAYLFGDPQYYPDRSDARTCADELASSRSAPVRGGPIDRLPCTRAEVEMAGSALQSHGFTVSSFVGDAASESALLTLHGPSIVHIATHGFFFPDAARDQKARFATGGAAAYEDPLMRSGLIFAGGGATWQGQPRESAASDGILTAYEAADLDLRGTQLVVLSACDSGLGVTTDGEGVFGLQRAFAEAGAKMVMMSMWDVPDLETQELLQSFYQKWLGGTDAFQALRAAELQERDVVKQRYGHDVPKDWAGFMLVKN